MTRPLLPPDFVKTPIGLLFDPKLSPTLKITWQQLRAMAWGTTETPPFTAAEFEEMTGTDVKTLYKHMGALRAHGAFRWRRGNGSTFIVSFECDDQTADQPPNPSEILNNENSQNGELPLSLAPDQKLDQSDQKLADSQNREFSKSRKPTSPAGKPPPRFDALFEAIAKVTRRMPQGGDWSKLTKQERGTLNEACGQLRKIGATAEQVYEFPDKFKKLQKENYRLRHLIEPWDLTKYWSQVFGEQNGPTSTTSVDGTVSERVAAIQQRRAQQRTGAAPVPALPATHDADA